MQTKWNKNESTKYQNVWDAVGKVIALNTYYLERKIPKMNHLSLHFKKLKKEDQIKCKVSKRK